MTIAKTRTVLVVAYALTLIASCAITHKFQPHEVRVVDAETNEPIAGAVVLLEFWTERYTPGGFTSVFADAAHATCDRKTSLLKTNEERRKNLWNAHAIGVPSGKKTNLQRMMNEARKEIGSGADPHR